MGKKSSKSVIGIEMDSTEIRAVELGGTRQAPIVKHYGSMRIPQEVLTNAKGGANTLSSCLEQLLHTEGFDSQKVCVGVHSQDVILRMASFQKVSPDKMRKVILFQAQDFIPVPLSELILDYVLSDEHMVDQTPHVNALLVGARKTLISSVIELAKQTNLEVVDIDSSVLAVGRAIISQCPLDVATFLSVHLNRDMLSMTVFKNGLITMARSISTPASMQKLIDEYSPQEGFSDMQLQELSFALLSEIKSAIQYYRLQREEPIDLIYLTAPFSGLDVIADLIMQEIVTPTAVPTLYPNIAAVNAMGINTLEYGVCISLALRGLEG